MVIIKSFPIFGLCYKRFLIYIPSIAVAFLCLHLTVEFILQPFNKELNEAITLALKMSATLAGLSFYAGYMTTHHHKKPYFYVNGERFFHGTVLFFSINLLQKSLYVVQQHSLPELLSVSLSTVLICANVIFLLYSTICFALGLNGLLHVLHQQSNKRADQVGAELKDPASE